MIIESRGYVTQVDSPSTGWYKVALTHSPNIIVSGVSLKNTVFTVGLIVIVFQYGFWGGALNEFGFTELATNTNFESLRGQIQLTPQAFEFCAQQAPAQVVASYIANIAGNKGLRYFPATVTAISGSNLACKDYFEKTLGILPVASDLSASDFTIGDIVLIQTTFEGHIMMVLGWWRTVPSSEDEYFLVYWDAGYNFFYKNLFKTTAETECSSLPDYSYDWFFINEIPCKIDYDFDYERTPKLILYLKNLISGEIIKTLNVPEVEAAPFYFSGTIINDFINCFVIIDDSLQQKALRIATNFESYETFDVFGEELDFSAFLFLLNNKKIAANKTAGDFILNIDYTEFEEIDYLSFFPAGGGQGGSIWWYDASGTTITFYNDLSGLSYSKDLLTLKTFFGAFPSNEIDEKIFIINSDSEELFLDFVIFDKTDGTFTNQRITTENIVSGYSFIRRKKGFF